MLPMLQARVLRHWRSITVSTYGMNFSFAYTLTQEKINRTLPLSIWEFKGAVRCTHSDDTGSAALTVVPMIILFIFTKDKLIEGMAAGAVKG